jgi:hypothetical protein
MTALLNIFPALIIIAALFWGFRLAGRGVENVGLQLLLGAVLGVLILIGAVCVLFGVLFAGCLIIGGANNSFH